LQAAVYIEQALNISIGNPTMEMNQLPIKKPPLEAVKKRAYGPTWSYFESRDWRHNDAPAPLNSTNIE
jgi:hypothetical protein